MAVFVDVCDVVIKAQFIVKDDASVLKALHHLHWLAVDRSGAMKGGEFTAGVKDELLRDAEVDQCAHVLRLTRVDKTQLSTVSVV